MDQVWFVAALWLLPALVAVSPGQWHRDGERQCLVHAAPPAGEREGTEGVHLRGTGGRLGYMIMVEIRGPGGPRYWKETIAVG